MVHDFFWAKKHYKLARLYERTNQDDKARESYSRFLELWHGADDDIPEILDARIRLAALSELTP